MTYQDFINCMEQNARGSLLFKKYKEAYSLNKQIIMVNVEGQFTMDEHDGKISQLENELNEYAASIKKLATFMGLTEEAYDATINYLEK
jgi:hypothetical protein